MEKEVVSSTWMTVEDKNVCPVQLQMVWVFGYCMPEIIIKLVDGHAFVSSDCFS